MNQQLQDLNFRGCFYRFDLLEATIDAPSLVSLLIVVF
ncbi:hypothetical protein PanWU01x14_254490 [Parasponia andersonii]|uniref:Uncharacterized protein n=1 Tax=Parasponia andersonii TaxID=3476 RepID=A0A2P5BB58_PARAD|nr:hypothetical protein PanWU01x14_254490 [Parasponia andersonii]